MASRNINVKFLLRNDTSTNWTSANPVLSKGEMGIETDTRKHKFGDGTTAWNDLAYASSGNTVIRTAAPTTSDTGYDVGTLWVNTTSTIAYILFSVSGGTATWVELASSSGTVTHAATADKLKTARTITMDGAVVSNAQQFDGSADITFTLVLAASGVTAGTYTKLTVNDKGLVTSAEQLAASDIPELTLSKITDAGTAASKNVGTASGNVPVLDSAGKLNTSVLPSLALTEVYEVENQTAMLALLAQPGDVAIRTDENKSYILAAEPASTLANWKLLRTPTDAVLSVNGKTGAVTLTTDDVTEGSTNLYFTEARATNNFNTNFALKSVTGLSDGANVLMTTDTYIFDGGNA